MILLVAYNSSQETVHLLNSKTNEDRILIQLKKIPQALKRESCLSLDVCK